MINELQYTLLLTLALGSIFGFIFWLQIYMETYRHFPKMDKHKRIIMSATSATVATIILLIAVTLFMYWLFEHIIK